MLLKAVNIRRGRYADDKAPEQPIPQMQALNLLENKISAQHEFIDHCILSSANGIQREIKVKGQKLSTLTSFKCLGGSCFTSWLKTRSYLKDCTSHCSSYKAEANF